MLALLALLVGSGNVDDPRNGPFPVTEIDRLTRTGQEVDIEHRVLVPAAIYDQYFHSPLPFL